MKGIYLPPRSHPRGLFHWGHTNSKSKFWKTPCCDYLENNNQIWSQFCTHHDSSAVVMCAKLWLHQIIKIIIKMKRIFTRFQLWAHTTFVKWVPANKIVTSGEAQTGMQRRGCQYRDAIWEDIHLIHQPNCLFYAHNKRHQHFRCRAAAGLVDSPHKWLVVQNGPPWDFSIMDDLLCVEND